MDRLFEGTAQLTKALQPLLQAAERTLELDERKRARTLVRIDAGGGSLDEVNWLLLRGYQVLSRVEFSSACLLASRMGLSWYLLLVCPQFGKRPAQQERELL